MADAWEWRWEPHEPTSYRERLIARAMRLRQHLRRGESAPVLPRSRLEHDATASQAESFLISRPWFAFDIEVIEEQIRYWRLPHHQRLFYPHSVRRQVIEWWKERGDWRDEFGRTKWVTSWKWRHESPSPEPEDLLHIESTSNMKDSLEDMVAIGLHYMTQDNPLDKMDFTPSETDALEAIELPRPEQPKKFWSFSLGDPPPYFPGQSLDVLNCLSPPKHSPMPPKLSPVSPRSPLFRTPEEAPIQETCPMSPRSPLFRTLEEAPIQETCPMSPRYPLFRTLEEAPIQETSPEPQRDTPSQPPQKARRKRQLREADLALPPPRRSARISSHASGIKRKGSGQDKYRG